MAVSNSYDFTVTRDELIKAALQILKVVDVDSTPTAGQVTSAARDLNMMIKAWRVDSGFLWDTDWITKTLSASSAVIGDDLNEYKCIRPHTSSTSTEPGNTPAQPDASTYWEATGEVGLAATWTTSTAYYSIGSLLLPAEVIWIDTAFVRRDGTDYPLRIITKDEFLAIPDKASTGMATSVHFSRELGQPELYLWPMPDVTTDVIHLNVMKKAMDFDSSTDSPCFTEEWYEALKFGLASKQSFIWNVPKSERDDLRLQAYETKRLAMMGDTERTDLRISPARR